MLPRRGHRGGPYEHWVEQLNVGPWFLLEHFTGERGTYRGEPGDVDVALAMAHAGHMLVELIAPHDDRPSVYQEAIERGGYGFHHFGVGTLDYDAEVARHREQGHELAFETWVPTGGRVGYVDTTAELPGYLELIEMDDATDAAFTRFYAPVAGVGRDRSGPPVRVNAQPAHTRTDGTAISARNPSSRTSASWGARRTTHSG